VWISDPYLVDTSVSGGVSLPTERSRCPSSAGGVETKGFRADETEGRVTDPDRLRTTIRSFPNG
jgi:hypothetical protein